MFDDPPATAVDIVAPTIGRASLHPLLAQLQHQRFAGTVFVVDDRPGPVEPIVDVSSLPLLNVRVLRSHGRGPAAARNAGWRASRATWIAFVDDDVALQDGWVDALRADLDVDDGVAGTQGRVEVPLPDHRPPTDWERNVGALARSAWVTADMAYRRDALRQVGGFDERFPRAYREDADLALRVMACGHRLVRGARQVLHPVGPAPWYVSVTKQAGNADDVLMDRLHGHDWRARADAPTGAYRQHLTTTALAVGAGLTLIGGFRRTAGALAAAWGVSTARFAAARIAPGPRTRREIAAMAITSIAIPPVAVAHRWRGRRRAERADARSDRPRAVLFDRDGTLVHDVPYNGDPALVAPVEGARDALERLRAAGIRIGIVTNQSAVGRGMVTRRDVDAVHRRLSELLGPFDVIAVCEHTAEAGCACRKPKPALVLEAARQLDVHPTECVVIGDTAADMDAARAAGARGVLVPNAVTRPSELSTAPAVAADLATALDVVLGAA